MAKKDRKAEKRKQVLKDRKRAERQRIAVQRDGGNSTVIRQRTGKGYDVQMIRDFLDHLLLEVRIQQFENVKALRSLKESGDIETAVKAAEEPSATLHEQFQTYQRKYESCLIASNAIDGANATAEESRKFIKTFLKANIERRDEEIGHLEALQDLFDEAFTCAKTPFGFDQAGNPVGPIRTHRVREAVDEAVGDSIPDLDDLLPIFEGHAFTTEPFIQKLKDSKVIIAQSDAYDQRLVLFGADVVEQAQKSGDKNVAAFPIPVACYRELQFILAIIKKYVGPPDTDGTAWRDI